MNKIHLALALHSHQPLGNFENVFEDAYQKAYLPFLESVASHPFLKINFHYSGILLDWLERRHPEYLETLRTLHGLGQIEMMGGGHYEPILSILPAQDARAQVEKLANKLAGLFGKTPAGCWLAERVWEQPLAATLNQAGVRYVILDDIHFLWAGLQPDDLTGYFITEDQGQSVKLIPGSKRLRYTIPFADPWVTIDYLRQIAERKSDALVVMADDCEKFGSWPKTHKHVYEDRWLPRFIEELEKNSSWIEPTCLSSYVGAFPPSGRIYLPNASYSEMMEWALPVESREVQHRCLERLGQEADAERLLPYVRGGYWRNFLAKYREVDLLHKKMLMASRRLERLRQARPSVHDEGPWEGKFQSAYDCLLRAQCNDAYWHGVFGGVYAPHLRTALLASLIEANRRAEELECFGRGESRANACRIERVDYDADGVEEWLVHTPQLDLIIDPADGATALEIDFKPCTAPLINSITRQPEFYHRSLHADAGSSPDPAIRAAHERLTLKEKELAGMLRYDHSAKNGFRVCLFPAWKSIADYDRQQLDEHVGFASGWFEVPGPGPAANPLLSFRASGHLYSGGVQRPLQITKHYHLEAAGEASRICCDLELYSEYPFEGDWKLGIENVLNFLAPTADDRFISTSGEPSLPAAEGSSSGEFKAPLSWFGVLQHRESIAFTDGWRRMEARLGCDQKVDWWIAPIYSISNSEDGLERLYQGSQILAVLPPLSWTGGAATIRHWLDVSMLY